MAAPRTTGDGPFCWASKEALRMIHGAFSETDNLPSGLSVYMALAMIASDEQAEAFTIRKALIAFKAGVSIRTAGDVLKRFELMRLVKIDRHSTTGGTPDAASTYTLLRVSNGCTGVSNGCTPVGNQPERSFIADKVEESEKNLSEESQKETPSSPAARKQSEFSSDVLEKIYQAFPRREGKQPALRSIRKALVTVQKRGESDPVTWMLARVVAYTEYCNREGKEKQHIKMPQGWFGDARYDDDLSQPTAPLNGVNGHAPSKLKPVPSMSAQIAAHQLLTS